MYKILVDGKLLYSTGSEDTKAIVLSPNLTLDVNSAGSLSFVIPPGNSMHGSLKKMKSIVTVKQDGNEIFHGRVLEIETDIWNQQSVYCEGALSFLMDSVQKPTSFSGKAAAFFRNIIKTHNEQVDAEKRFTVGNITAVTESEEMPSESAQYTTVYWNTSDMINDNFVNVFGGYLMTRTSGGKLYIDWLKNLGGNDAEEIRFAVNMLDLKDKTDANDMFTILIPLGWSEIDSDGTRKDPVSIESVNNGKNYIQDDEAVALYGKIWRTHTWGSTKEPSELLKKARKHLSTHGSALRTLTIKAVDMRFVNGNADMIRIGQDVHIVSEPHGIDIKKACVKMSIDLTEPENTSYTFGEKPKTLTESISDSERDLDDVSGRRGGGGGRGGVQDQLEEIQRWARFFKDEHEGLIGMNAGEIDGLTGRVKQAEVAIDGANAVINAHAEVLTEQGELISSALLRIDGAEAEIEARVEKDGVISAINMTPESITIQAKRVNLEAIETKITNLTTGITKAKLLATGTLEANSAILGALTLRDDYISKSQKTVATGVEYADLDYTGGELKGVTVKLKTDEIYYLGW